MRIKIVRNSKAYDRIQEGERFFLEQLSKATELEGWTVYEQPRLNGDRPDFVLCHPEKGIVIVVVFANIKFSHFARKNVSHSISSENTVLIWSERHDRLVAYRNTLMCRLSSEIMPLEAPCQDAPDLPFVNF